MKNLRCSRVDLKTGFGKARFLSKEKKTNPQINMSLSSIDIMCASNEEEFFYTHTNEVVPEGEPIGFDMENGDAVDLVLFSDVSWKPFSEED